MRERSEFLIWFFGPHELHGGFGVCGHVSSELDDLLSWTGEGTSLPLPLEGVGGAFDGPADFIIWIVCWHEMIYT